MKFKVLIVDDEEPARDLLASYAQKIEELEVVGIVNNALEAKKMITDAKVDILLTDIHMDDLTGIDLVRSLKYQPITIFTTAYSEYALEGFELDITDYLVKPISFQRFFKAMNKAMELIQFKKTFESQKTTAKESTTVEKNKSNFLFVKTNRKMVKVDYGDILYIESYGEYVKIFTRDDVILALQTTSFMEKLLPKEDFIRIHRSHIININQIIEVDGNQVIIDKHRLTISKRAKESFMNMIKNKGII